MRQPASEKPADEPGWLVLGGNEANAQFGDRRPGDQYWDGPVRRWGSAWGGPMDEHCCFFPDSWYRRYGVVTATGEENHF